MAIIPLALCTIPLMRNVSIIRPAFPGGRFSGGALLARALVSSVSNGSRRTVAFSSAGFSTGGLAGFADATFVASLAAGAFAADFSADFSAAFAGAFARAFAGAFAGAFAVAGAAGFAGGGAGVCGALGAWDPLETGFDNWSRTALGWTLGCSCARAHVARTADM